jgi:GNAT superfamily N-acetyltransferase
MTAFEIERLTSDDWRDYRDVRLAALADAPWAFGGTLEREQRFSERDFRSRLEDRAMFVARHQDRVIGLIGGLQLENEDAILLISMWVHPEFRGQGAGDLLVRAVLDWAQAHASPEVRLWVSEGNSPAERLYARNGFVRTGEWQPVHPDDPSRREFAMVCTLPRT